MSFKTRLFLFHFIASSISDFDVTPIKDFDIFLAENDHFEINYSPEIQKTFDLFKKGNKYIKKYFYLPKYQNYSPKEIIKNLIFKDILSFLTPIEQYLFSKSNKESLIKYRIPRNYCTPPSGQNLGGAIIIRN